MGARYETPGNADETALNGVAATCCTTNNLPKIAWGKYFFKLFIVSIQSHYLSLFQIGMSKTIM